MNLLNLQLKVVNCCEVGLLGTLCTVVIQFGYSWDRSISSCRNSWFPQSSYLPGKIVFPSLAMIVLRHLTSPKGFFHLTLPPTSLCGSEWQGHDTANLAQGQLANHNRNLVFEVLALSKCWGLFMRGIRQWNGSACPSMITLQSENGSEIPSVLEKNLIDMR